MKCRSCEADIPPTFVKSIQDNICPACGKDIASEDDLELLAELTSAMEKMPNNPQGLAGWLLSNYKCVKIGDAEPVDKFYTGDSKDQQEQQGDSQLTDFFKRTGNAGAFKQAQAKMAEERNKKIASVAQNITQAGIEDEMYGDVTTSEVSLEGLPEAATEDQMDISNVSLGINTDNVKADPHALAEFNKILSKKTELDVAVESDKTQQLRMKRLMQQQNFDLGAGGFKRSE